MSVVEFIDGISQFSVKGNKDAKLQCKLLFYSVPHYTVIFYNCLVVTGLLVLSYKDDQ